MHPTTVFQTGFYNAALGISFRPWVFARCIKKVRTTEFLTGFFFNSHVEKGENLTLRVSNLCGAFCPSFAVLLIERFHISNNERVFRAKERIERSLSHIGFTQDTVNTDNADAFGCKKVRCRCQQTVTRTRAITARLLLG